MEMHSIFFSFCSVCLFNSLLTRVVMFDIQVSWTRVVWYGKHTVQALYGMQKNPFYSGQA